MGLVNDLVYLPIVFQPEVKNRGRGLVELAVPDPHQDWRIGLKTAMVDLHADFGIAQLVPLVFVVDRAGLVHPEGKGAVQLGVGSADRGIADLDIVAELEIAALLSEAPHGSAVTQGCDIPQIVTGAAIDLLRVQNHLFPVQLHGARLQDARHVEKLRKQIPGDFIWFQRDEKSYIIRDQATVERARKLWAPQQELGAKQEELGKQQEALGKQQEELGARMERIQVKVPDMTAELDKLRAELKSLSYGATAEQVGRIQSEIGELQSKIGEVQSNAGEQQSKIGEEMGALGEKQGKLGEQQGELGRRQGELAKQAIRQMKDLLDEAIKKGTAQPEPQSSDAGTL